MGCFYMIADTIITFTIMLIGVYQTASKYKLSTILLLLLFLASFLKYLDIPPKNPSFRPLASIIQGLELLMPVLVLLGITMDMNIDPWKYRLEREQYEGSFMNQAFVYWHIKNNFFLVVKLYSLSLMQLCSAAAAYSIATTVISCPEAAGLAILTIIPGAIILLLTPQILEKGYENLQFRNINA